MTFALLFTFVMNFGAYWFSDKIVLKMHRAQPVTEEEAPELYGMVRELALKAQIPMPKVYILPSASPNAFATGRNPQNAAVAATQGIISLLSYDELKGVMAHELGHVIHRDTLISCVAATLAGAIAYMATMLRWTLMFTGGRGGGDRRDSNPIVMIALSILMPIAASLIQMAVSRSREYAADKKGAELCGNPLFLASALQKISGGVKTLPMRDANPSTSHLFIMNPLSGGGFTTLFSTHPPVEDRVARLEAMARSQGL